MSNAVTALYEAYKDGASFIDSSDIAVFLESKGFGTVGTRTASKFDTGARQQCHEQNVTVESPTAENNWRRGGQLVTQAEKEKSRLTRLRYSRTHVHNTAVITAADALAFDASDEMVLVANLLQKADLILQGMKL